MRVRRRQAYCCVEKFEGSRAGSPAASTASPSAWLSN